VLKVESEREGAKRRSDDEPFTNMPQRAEPLASSFLDEKAGNGMVVKGFMVRLPGQAAFGAFPSQSLKFNIILSSPDEHKPNRYLTSAYLHPAFPTSGSVGKWEFVARYSGANRPGFCTGFPDI